MFCTCSDSWLLLSFYLGNIQLKIIFIVLWRPYALKKCVLLWWNSDFFFPGNLDRWLKYCRFISMVPFTKWIEFVKKKKKKCQIRQAEAAKGLVTFVRHQKPTTLYTSGGSKAAAAPARIRRFCSTDAAITVRCSIITNESKSEGEFSILGSQLRSENAPVRKDLRGKIQPALMDWSDCPGTLCGENRLSARTMLFVP